MGSATKKLNTPLPDRNDPGTIFKHGDIFNKLSEQLGIGADECTADGRFSLTACRCIGACGLAPVLTVNEEVYGRLTVKDIPDILAKYKD